MSLHSSTFEYLKPTDNQLLLMGELREAAKHYADFVDALIQEGPDKDHILRSIRQTAMWINVTVTRESDGTPRT